MVFDVTAEQYRLTVDARDTVNEVLDSCDRETGSRLENALALAQSDECVFVLDESADVSYDAFHPNRVDDLPTVDAPYLDDVVRHLEKEGYLRSRDVLVELNGDNYLNEGRVITTYEVIRPFRLASVRYREVTNGDYYRRARDRWYVDEVTPVITAGLYVAGLVGDYRLTLVGIGETEPCDDEELMFYWLVEFEGFLASHCSARCSGCGAEWFAECGSWYFRAETPDAAPDWAYDDVEDFYDDDTVGCPVCTRGRVGFLIF